MQMTISPDAVFGHVTAKVPKAITDIPCDLTLENKNCAALSDAAPSSVRVVFTGEGLNGMDATVDIVTARTLVVCRTSADYAVVIRDKMGVKLAQLDIPYKLKLNDTIAVEPAGIQLTSN